MGGGGFAQHANNVMRANRALLKKRKFKDIKKLVLEKSGKTELEFKEVSAEKLDQIKREIRSEAKKAAQIEMGVNLLCLVLILSVLYWLFFMV